MENNEMVFLKPFTTPEIPLMIKELGIYAHINLSEREFRKMIAEKDVFKAMSNSTPFGIVAITPKALAEITVWLSDVELKEKWAEAIKKTILKAFEKPEVFKIKWPIAESCKEMVVVAQGCGFKKEGEHQNEGLNGETMIAFGLSRNGNSPESFLRSNTGTETEQEKIILSLKTKLRDAEELNKSLQKSLFEVDEKRRIAENDLFLLKEKTEKSSTGEKAITTNVPQQKITEMEATIKQLNEKNAKLKICVSERTKQVTNQAKTIIELQEIVNASNPKNASITSTKTQKDEPGETEKPPNPENAEVETSPTEINDTDLERLTRSLGITSENVKKILASILKHPGTTAKEISEETRISINNIFTFSNRLLAKRTGLGLVIKKQKSPDNKLIKAFWPIKGVMEKMQEMAAKKNSGKPQILKSEKEPVQPETLEKTPTGKKDEQSDADTSLPKRITEETDKTIPVVISRHHVEKAKNLLKANLEEGLSLVDLLKDLALPCDKKTAENLVRFIGPNFAFIEGNAETDFENCKIKIQENVANAIKRGNALIETIKKYGKQNGGENSKEWQINFGILCQKMSELGYDNPEKIKKSIKVLKTDPDTTREYQIYITYAEKGNFGENDLIKLIRQ